jgi:hypothetical protein
VHGPWTYLGGSHERMKESDKDAVFHLATVPSMNVVLSQPIQNFSAQQYNDDCLIQWNVAEADAMIQLQRSIDGEAFRAVANFTSAGNNRYLDNSVHKGFIYYYRLKIISASGVITYSSIRMVSIGSDNNNPVQAFVVNGNILRVMNAGEPSFIRVFSMSGQYISGKELTPGMNNIPLGQYSKGIYLYKTGKEGNGPGGKIFIQ